MRKDIQVYSLYSGSKGNSFLICAKGTCFLIDAGKSARSLCSAISGCGHSPDEISAIFVTHEHSDHIKALPVFLKKHPVPVHLPNACAYKLECEDSAVPCLRPHPPIHTEHLGDISVTSFPTPHDSRGSVGYRIEIPTEQGQFRIGYATDIGYVSPAVKEALTGCDAVILESNHDPELLRTGPYPYNLKSRIASRRGHLSNPDSACFAAYLTAQNTKSILLAHLSQENNTPELAYNECLCSIGNSSVHLSVADPDSVTELELEEDYLC